MLSLTAAAGQLLPGDGVLATLQFAAPAREHSVIVPLPVDELQGVLIGGSVLRNGRGIGGRVFVIGEEPLLDSLLETNGVRSLVLYGQPGRRFEIQSKAGLASPLAWETVRTVDLVNTWDLWSGLPVSAGQVFYRAVEVPSAIVDGIGTVSRLEDGRLEFRFTGIPQRRYVIEASSNLEQWTPVSTNAGPVGFTTPTGSLSGYKFFRVKAVP